MERLLDALWNPVLAGFVLSAGLLVLLGTLGLPLRRLAQGLGGWTRGPSERGGPLLLATSASMTTVTAAMIAVNVAGPGALVWMWIAMALGLATHFAEGKLARLHRARTPQPFAGAAKPLGGGLAIVLAVGLLMVGLVAGGTWQGLQAGQLLAEVAHVPLIAGASVVAGVALLANRVPSVRRVCILYAPPMAVALFVTLVGIVVSEDPLRLQLALGDAVNQAFGFQPAAVGTSSGAVSLLIAHGVMRAVMAADVGIGAAATATATDDAELSADAAGASVMLVPILASALLSTAAALVLLTETRVETPVAEPSLVRLERNEGRGLRASRQVGQTVVLPEDTALQKGKHYAMKLRASPRGHKMARLLDKENAVILPEWTIAESVDTVVFRAREPALARQAAWDVHVPCTRELFGGKDDGPQFVRLVPRDDGVVFSDLIALYELDPVPYVVLGDFSFTGIVSLANSPDEALGEHLAMFERRTEGGPLNPKLHEFFRNGYRGPYPDDDGAAAPPSTFVSVADFEGELGSVVSLVVRPDPRGIAAVRRNRVGLIEAPPWNAMLEVRELLLRHPSDPALDVRVPVAPRLDEHRIRFDALDPAWNDFRKMDKMEGYTGPFAVMGPHTFRAEVHSNTRLAVDHETSTARALVPLDTDPQVVGPAGRPTYDPHPAELLTMGYTGPFAVESHVTRLVQRVRAKTPSWGPGMLALVGLLLAITTTVGWSVLVRGPATHLMGDSAAAGLGILVCLAPVAGAVFGAGGLYAAMWAAYSAAAIPTLIALVLLLGDVRRAGTADDS